MKISSLRKYRLKNNNDEEEGLQTEWLVTYGDLMGLLMTFFVLFYAVYALEKVPEFQRAMLAYQNKLKALQAGDRAVKGAAEDLWLRETKSDIQSYIIEQGLTTNIRLQMRERGLAIIMTSSLLFALGESKINPSVYPILDEIYALVVDKPNTIWVEGHTDNLPVVSGRYRSNWELSMYRAISVIQYFLEEKSMPPERLVAVGYGEYRPAFDNDTATHRALNRRVEIVILKQGYN